MSQQTKSDLAFQMKPQDCLVLLRAMSGMRSARCCVPVRVHATALKVRSRTTMEMVMVVSDSDELWKESGAIVWSMEPDSAEGMVERLKAASEVGYFAPAELMTVAGPGGKWLRLYAVIV